MLLPERRAPPAKFETEFGLWRGAWLFTASDEGCAHHSPLDDRTATRVEIGAATIELGERSMTDVPFGKKLRIPFVFKDASGKVAKVDGAPTIATTFGNVIETVQAGDVWSALIDPAGVGSGSVTGSADVDLGSGVKQLAFPLGDFTALASPEAAAVEVGTATIEG